MITNSLRETSLNTIRLFPVVSGLPYDPTKPPKDWSAKGYQDPNQTIEGYYVFDVVTIDQTTQLPKFSKLVMSVEDAEAANPRPANYIGQSGVKVPPPVPFPVDKTKIPAGWELGTGLMGSPALVPSGQNTSPVHAYTDEDHSALMEILSWVRSHK